jgi:RsiW-degrading membrane proteinase PrsW (M82 family)
MHAPSPSPGARRVSPPGAPPGTALDARANRSYPRRVSLPDPERTRRHIGGEIVGAAVCAPIVEEFWKGLAVFGMFYFWRREFDGVVDGIIYATFAALGFAAVENVVYYARAGTGHASVDLTSIFILRGVVTPWAHPLFTSMTGIGFGLAREVAEHAHGEHGLHPAAPREDREGPAGARPARIPLTP